MGLVEHRDRGLIRILSELRKMQHAEVQAGFFDPEEAYIASLQEYGSREWTITPRQAYFMAKHLMGLDPESDKARFWGTVRTLTGKKMRIPERAFMRGTLAAEQGAIRQGLRDALLAITMGKANALQVLEGFGIEVQTLLQNGMREFNEPANAPLTVAVKGFDDPLIHTGHLMRSLRYWVRGAR